jgi:hypothetical protein
MILKLDDHFKITTDSSKQNFQLEQLSEVTDRKTKETKLEWSIIGFHGNSLRSVLLQYRNVSLITDDKLETLHSVLDKLSEIERTIVNVVKQQNIKLVSTND